MPEAWYPVWLNLSGQLCLVVGGGQVAYRKVQGLLACGARVRVASPELAPELNSLADQGKIAATYQPYSSNDLEGVLLAIAATDNQEVNQRVSREALSRGILVNIVDQPQAGNFIVPSVVRCGDLVFGISTGGQSPFLARLIRQELEQLYGPEVRKLLLRLTQLRRQLKAKVATSQERQKIWEQLLDLELLSWARQGQWENVEERIRSAVPLSGPEP